MGNNNNNGTISGANNSNKRPLSTKKGPKNRGKSSKQQRTAISPQQQGVSASTQQGDAPNFSTSLPTSGPLAAPQNSGFASLLEAASTDGGAPQHQQYQQNRQQDIAMTDGASGPVDENDHHRHLQHQQTNSLLNQLQSQVPPT